MHVHVRVPNGTGVPYLVLGEVVGQPSDEDLVVTVRDRARDDAENGHVQLGDRARPGLRKACSKTMAHAASRSTTRTTRP